MKLRHSQVPDSCRPVTDILSRIGDKWSVGVIRNLGMCQVATRDHDTLGELLVFERRRSPG